MDTIKIVGGILAYMGGSFLLLQTILIGTVLSFSIDETIGWLLNLIIALLVLVGSILGLLEKRVGAWLVLLAGVLSIFFGILTVSLTNSLLFWPYSFFTTTLQWFIPPYHLGMGVSIESLLMVLGGLCLFSSAYEQSSNSSDYFE